MGKPPSPAEMLARAIACQQAGKPTEAEQLYRAVLAVLPHHPEANCNLGELAARSGRHDLAVSHFRSALEADPSSGLFWLNYINALIKAGAPMAARHVLLQGRQRGLAGSEIEALSAAADTGIEVNARMSEAAERHVAGHLDEAEAAFRHILELQPDSAAARCNLGTVLLDLGRFDEAFASFQRALDANPNLAEAHYAMGNVFIALGRFEAAAESFRRALDLNPDLAEAHFNRGEALARLDRMEDAAASYRRALDLKPDFARALDKLGRTHLDSGRMDEAAEHFRRALEITPDLAEASARLGEIWRLRGHPDRESSLCRATVDALSPRFGTVHRVEGLERAIALIPIGRAGSVFFQSLVDGHPEVSTIPGPFLMNWFDDACWARLRPDTSRPEWRRRFVETVLCHFEPLFDAQSPINPANRTVPPGLAEDCGFTEMGPDRNMPFRVDRDAFGAALLARLDGLADLSAKDAFKLFHLAFDHIAGRPGPKSTIFYHIHVNDPIRLGTFVNNFNNSKILYMTRNPVQSIESTASSFLTDKPMSQMLWKIVSDGIVSSILNFHPVIGEMTEARGIRLEDVNTAPRRVIPQIAAWMGISDHPSLYESSFCGLQYWGPNQNKDGPARGFTTAAIDRKIGKLFGPRDVIIFETLFWPFSKAFGYSTRDEAAFRSRLRDIRPWLEEPLEFERSLYDQLPEPRPPIGSVSAVRRLHSVLECVWTRLEQQGDFPNLLRPLPIEL